MVKQIATYFHLTRRSAFLALFGFAYAVIGFSYVKGPPSDTLEESLKVALHVMPLWGFGIMWLICGLTAILTGVTRRYKEIGFGLLTAIGIVWGSAYLVGWLHGDTSIGYRTTVIFWMISGAVHIVAGMVEAPKQ